MIDNLCCDTIYILVEIDDKTAEIKLLTTLNNVFPTNQTM
jgi:hypothetical protein